MAQVATFSDVAISLGRPITEPTEQAQIEWWLQSAELQIRTRLGDLDDLDQDVLFYVVVEAAAAKATNPEGATSESIDDYTYRLPTETRRVTILDEWWAMLRPTTRRGRAFTVQPT